MDSHTHPQLTGELECWRSSNNSCCQVLTFLGWMEPGALSAFQLSVRDAGNKSATKGLNSRKSRRGGRILKKSCVDAVLTCTIFINIRFLMSATRRKLSLPAA